MGKKHDLNVDCEESFPNPKVARPDQLSPQKWNEDDLERF